MVTGVVLVPAYICNLQVLAFVPATISKRALAAPGAVPGDVILGPMMLPAVPVVSNVTARRPVVAVQVTVVPVSVQVEFVGAAPAPPPFVKTLDVRAPEDAIVVAAEK